MDHHFQPAHLYSSDFHPRISQDWAALPNVTTGWIFKAVNHDSPKKETWLDVDHCITGLTDQPVMDKFLLWIWVGDFFPFKPIKQ